MKSHTIRTWEKRHLVLNPGRSTGNTRYYGVGELEKLLHLSLLSRNGHKISRLANGSFIDLQEGVKQLSTSAARVERSIHELIGCMYRLNVACFENILNDCFLTWPAETVVNEIIFPFLQRVDLLCAGRLRSEEHLVVTALRKKLLWSIERIDAPRKQEKTALLFLPQEKQLDLLLLYLYFQLERKSCSVLYLGADISLKNLEEMFAVKKVDYLFTYLPRKHSFPLTSLSGKMTERMPQAKMMIVGRNDNELPAGLPNIQRLKLDEVNHFLERV